MKKSSHTDRHIQQKRYTTLHKHKKSQIQSTQSLYPQIHRYYLGSGNNADLIRRIMSTRRQWQQVNDSKYLFLNFRWQQTSKSYRYQNCIDNKIFKHCLNHFQFHHELSNKEYLFRNLVQYCQAHKIDVYDFVPVTFVLNLTESLAQQNLNAFLKVFDQYLPEQMKASGRKSMLFIKKRRTSAYKNLQIKQKDTSKYPIRDPFIQEKSKYLWILKPTSQNRGTGIHVFNNLQSLQNLINAYITGQSPNKLNVSPQHSSSPQIKKSKSFRIRQYNQPTKHVVTSFIVQKYLEKPLLIDKRKFDIRVWVLFTHEMKVYLFKQGYIRTSSYRYCTGQEAIGDLNVHLTNNAVQKNNTEYGKYEDGNQLSFKYLKNLIQSQGHNYADVITKIKWIIKITALCARKKINRNERHFCFQIFGYDFMFDENCKPWLIEVNTNPCIQESSQLLQNLLPRMLDDAFCLTIDRIFSTQKKGYNYSLQNQYSTDNLWQLIVDLKKNQKAERFGRTVSVNVSQQNTEE